MDHGRDSEVQGLHVLGVSTRSAPLTVRERLALDDGAIGDALERARTMLGVGVGGALVLSTCNRTELVVDGATSAEALDAWHRTVVAGRADDACPAMEASRYHLAEAKAVRHLLRVACGLESSVLGDAEIVGQLRRSAARARDAGVLGGRLPRLLDGVFRAAKRARSTTPISAGGAGVGSAVASVVAGHARPGAPVVLLGAGNAASVVARELTKRLPVRLTIVNRNVQRAAHLVERVGGRAVAPHEADGVLLDAAVVVAATASPVPVLTAATVQRLRERMPSWSPLVVDAGMPRNVETVPGLAIVALDSLAEREDRVRRLRESAVPAVERIVDDAVEAWVEQERSRSAVQPMLPAA